MAFNAGTIEATLDLNRNPFTAGLAAARSQARSFEKDKIQPEIQPRLDRVALANVKAQLDKVVGRATLKVSLDRTSLAAVKERIDRTIGTASVRAKLDTTSLRAVQERINRAVGSINVRTRLDADSLAALRERVNRSVGNITVRARLDSDSLAAIRERINRSVAYINVRARLDRDSLAVMRARIESMRPTVNVNVRGDSAVLANIIRQLNGIPPAANSASNAANNFGNNAHRAFRHADGAMRVFIGGMPLILPALGSAVTGAIGLLGALTSAFGMAAAGLAAFAIPAVGMFKQVLDSMKASSSGATQLANTFDQVASARRNLERVMEQAAANEARAARQVEDAERSLTAAKQRLTDAQEALTRAIRDTKEEMEDLQLSLRGAALAEEQAVLDLAEAQERLAEARKEGLSGNDLKQLELDVKRAALAIDETRERYGDLKAESDEFARSGVNGSERVRDAQRGVADAAQGVSDAERDLADARANQAQVQRESLRDIADAQEQLAKANRALAEAQMSQAKALSAAMMTVRSAIERIQGEYNALMKRVEAPVAASLVAWVDAAAAALRTLDPMIIATAKAMESIGRQIERYFGTEHWKNFVDFVSKNVGPTLDNLFKIFANLIRAVMNLIIAFDPLADRLLPAMVKGLEEFNKWLEKLPKNPEFIKFMDLAATSLEKVWKFLVSVVKFFFELSVALAPVGNIVLDLLTKVFDGLSKLPPEWLAGIAVGLSAIFAALLFGASAPVAAVIGVILGVAAALVSLYDSNEKVRKSVDDMVKGLKETFLPIWDDVKKNWEDKIKPAWDELVKKIDEHLVPALERLGDKFETEVLSKLRPIANTITGELIPSFLEFLAAIQPIVGWIVDNIGGLAVDAIKTFLEVFDYTLKEIASFFRFWAAVFRGDWDAAWEEIKISFGLKMGLIETLFGEMWQDLKKTLSEEKEIITEDWNGMWSGLGTTLEEEYKIWQEAWINFWGGIKVTQNGEQVIVESEWQRFLDSIGTTLDEEAAIWHEAWVNFWGGTKTEQDGSQTQIYGSWNTFWDNIGSTFDSWGTRLSTQWDQLWGGFQEKAKNWWDLINIGIDIALEWLGTLVATARDNLDREWRQIANRFREPIQWVIDVVLNDGVLRAWNTVMGWIGADPLKVERIPPIPQFATGGPVTGGTANKDSVRAWLMPGEYVLSKRAVAGLGGLSAVDQMHKAARGGSTPSPLGEGRRAGLTAQHLMRTVPMDDMHFAYGGVQPHVAAAGQEIERVFGAMPGGIHGLGSRPNKSDHPAGLALDFMTMNNVGLGNRIADYLAMNWGRLQMKYQIWRQRIANAPGAWQGMEDRGSPTANHMDHVHASFLGEGGQPNGLVSMLVSWWSLLGGKITGLFDGLKNFDAMPMGGPFGDAIKQMPLKLVEAAFEKVKEKAMNIFTTIFGGGGGDVSQITGPVVDQVRQVAAAYGWDQPPQWDAIYEIVRRESSWNPNAANPTSSARGLFQKMTSIHGPIEPTPAGQAQWGLNYIRGRYGTPTSALDFHNRNGWYDRGGWLMPGATAAFNGTGKPEAVLTAEQWRAFIANARATQEGGAPPIQIPTQQDIDNAVQFGLEKLGTTMTEVKELLERRGAGASIVVNDHSGNPTETARATVLGLRLS